MLRTRRLPGVRFAGGPSPAPEALPRMDVALFVGFAASGPLETPVAVEDPAGFAAVFGGELPLAWDPVPREAITTHLSAAVAGVFRQGGRRCWVVRVAGPTARANTFLVSGLLGLRATEDGPEFAAASVAARSAGSWSDSLRVGAAVDIRPLPHIGPLDAAGGSIEVTTAARGAVEGGDLLRLTYPRAGGIAFLGGTPGSGPRGATQAVAAVRQSGNAAVEFDPAPPPGSVVPLTSGSWLVVTEAGRSLGSPLAGDEVTGEAFEPLTAEALTTARPELLDPRPVLERVRLELWVRDGERIVATARDLGLTARHARVWGAMPTDEQAFDVGIPPGPRFPLAGDGRPWLAGLPLGLGVSPRWFVARNRDDNDPLVRDGLAEMSASLFKGGDDPRFTALDTASSRDLIGRLDYLRYQVEPPVRS